MKTPRRLTAVGCLAVAASALLTGAASASPAHHPDRDHATVFVQNDNTSGNTVYAYDRSSDGVLQWAGTYPTGGLGGILDGSDFDNLDSQGSLTYDRQHGLLYAVNAGSDTLTVFGVDGDHLTRRQVLATGGSFPVSVATNGRYVYVLNARNGGSIQGFLRLGGGLVSIPEWHRELGLDPTSPPEFIQKPGQVGFTPDGSKVIVTTKASGESIDVFSLDRWGTPAAQPVVTIDPLQVPFSFAFDSRDNLVVTEAFTNSVATFKMNRDGTLNMIERVATNQQATCWITVIGKVMYLSNAESANLSVYRDSGNGILGDLGTVNTDTGTVDTTASSDGRFLYVQTGAAGIVDEYHVHSDGSLTLVGTVTVPGMMGGEGIAAS
jgi:hypothetical protein